jgi:phospholipid/cholesterol/gamma-HCH transport system permease protein
MTEEVIPESVPIRSIRFVGEKFGDAIAEVGRVSMMVGEVLSTSSRQLPSFRLIVAQMNAIGVESLWLVLVVSVFTGAVAAVQAAYQFTSAVPIKYLSGVILRSVVIELGPVLTALVIGGRVGASIAAELGTMKVTEQIDALRAMGINPVRYLVSPRVIAATIMLPILTIYSDAIAILGGFVVAVTSIGMTPAIYVSGLQEFFYFKDIGSGILKAIFFGAIIGVMGCYNGFQTEGGAEGVGKATTGAVVTSCVMVLVLDYILATVLFRIIFK